MKNDLINTLGEIKLSGTDPPQIGFFTPPSSPLSTSKAWIPGTNLVLTADVESERTDVEGDMGKREDATADVESQKTDVESEKGKREDMSGEDIL